jgi:Holliday junction resolvasome RuvABC endonuclease subunit
MRPLRRFQRRVFAVNPCTRGFGFAVLEGPETLLDWGRKEVRNNKHTRSLQQINDLIEYYHPDVLVIEDYQDRSCRRCVRVRELIRDITALAGEKKVRTRSFSHREVRQAFSTSGAITKYAISGVIVERLPVLVPWRPPFRKPWMSESHRASIFDAVALALTFFHFTNKE